MPVAYCLLPINIVHKESEAVQDDAGAALVNAKAHFLGGDGLRENNPFVTDGGLLGDGAPVAVFILDFNVEFFYPLAERDIFLKQHAVESTRFFIIELRPSGGHGIFSRPIGVIVVYAIMI